MAGYIGSVPVPQATETRDVYTATSNQTTFTTGGYTPNFVSVYLNGVHLARADYTATNGSDVVLAVGAAADDTVEIVSFATFEVSAQTFTGDVTASGGTFLPTGDTAAGDDAAIGYTAAGGLILTGQGSTSDITLKNDADAVVFTVPTGTDDILFPDNAKAMFGAGSDLQIYHDGSNSYINEVGTGQLLLAGQDVRITTPNAGEFMATFGVDGAVTLYHNNAAKLATTATGATVTGAVKPTTYQETYVSKSAASTVTCDLATANHFAVTINQATTFAFSNPPSSGTSFAFTLIITQHSTAAALTWPNTVDWAGGSAPDAAGNNEVQAYGFITRDGGTTYYGFLGGTAIA